MSINAIIEETNLLSICILVCLILPIVGIYLFVIDTCNHVKQDSRHRLGKAFFFLVCTMLNALLICIVLQAESLHDLFGVRNIHRVFYCLIIQCGVVLVCGCIFRIIVRFFFLRDSYHARASHRNILRYIMLGALYCICIVYVSWFKMAGMRNIVINEVAANNSSIALDDFGTVCDYIELYNRSDAKCYTDELYLSDDPDMLKKKMIEPVTIPGRGYFIVRLDDDRLSIRKDGDETVYLSDIRGNIIDQVTTSEMKADFSFARRVDGVDDWLVQTSTPYESNAFGRSILPDAPVFSHQSGFYDDAFDLIISVQSECPIHYTLDGSIPTRESEQYSSPIHVYDRSKETNVYRNIKNVEPEWMDKKREDIPPVDKAFIVRAVAIDASGGRSEEVSATYFIDQNEYEQGNVISLIVDPPALWDKKDGIYVTGSDYDEWYAGDRSTRQPIMNFKKRGKQSEVEALFEYFSENLSFKQNIGLRISGASARESRLKRFSLFARKEYSGSNYFEENIIEDIRSHKYFLRNGLVNTVCQEIVRNRKVATQSYKPVSVFLNGEYWYKTSLLEKYDPLFFAQHYGVYEDNVIIFKEGVLDEGIIEDESLRDEIYAFLQDHDLEDPKNYLDFSEIIDIESYIDYMCINIYIDNMDFDETKNTVWWRTRRKTSHPYEDGRWRFCLYDLDALEWNDYKHFENCESQAQKNSFSLKPRFFIEAINSQPIFMALNRNEQFRRQFVLTFMDLVNENFRFENVASALMAYKNAFGSSSAVVEEFFRERPKWIVGYLAQEYDLTGSLETIVIKINNDNAGYIRLNSIMPSFSNGVWNGQYFTDYPISITAVPNEGYEFVRWEGSIESSEASHEVYLEEGGIVLHAVFEKAE